MADFDIIGRAYACKKKAFYSSEDIGKFKSILDDLPDVTSERLEKSTYSMSLNLTLRS